MAKQTSDQRRATKQGNLQEVAKHVSYEIRILIFSAEDVGGCHGSPVITPDGDYKNMALESFLLHFRNLRDFLCPSLLNGHHKDDDAFASDFIDKFDISDVGNPTKFPEEEQKKLNKMLAHISDERVRYIEARDYNWDTSEILVRVLGEMRRFVESLAENRRGWFPSIADLKGAENDALARIEMSGPVSNSTL